MMRLSIAVLAFLIALPLALVAQEQLSAPRQGYTFLGTNLRWFELTIADNNQAKPRLHRIRLRRLRPRRPSSCRPTAPRRSSS